MKLELWVLWKSPDGIEYNVNDLESTIENKPSLKAKRNSCLLFGIQDDLPRDVKEHLSSPQFSN